jgi:hypothetical protein
VTDVLREGQQELDVLQRQFQQLEQVCKGMAMEVPARNLVRAMRDFTLAFVEATRDLPRPEPEPKDEVKPESED